MPLLNSNTVRGIPTRGEFQVGDTNVDSAKGIERGIKLSTFSEADKTWVYFDCSISVMLDSGIVVHNRLPQVDREFDTLSSAELNDRLDKAVGGVSLKCNDQYQDIVQRMGHSRYWFRLYGKALRVRYQVPIPGIKFIGGVPAIPYDKNPQWAYNSIAPGGNYGGVVLWRAEWSLWYTTATQPTNSNIVSVDAMGHVSSTTPQPRSIQSPWSQPDDDSVAAVVAGKAVFGIGAAAAAAGLGRRGGGGGVAR